MQVNSNKISVLSLIIIVAASLSNVFASDKELLQTLELSNEQMQKYTDVYEQLSLANSGNNFACMGVSSDTKQMLVALAKVVNDNQAKSIESFYTKPGNGISVPNMGKIAIFRRAYASGKNAHGKQLLKKIEIKDGNLVPSTK